MAQTIATVNSDDRVAFVGQTGSGKTFLARHMLANVRRLIVLDPKGTLSQQMAPEWNLEEWSNHGERMLEKGERMRMRVPAPLPDNSNPGEYWDNYLQAAWEIGNVTVYIDEVYGIVDPGTRPSRWLTALYTRGREMKIGVWAATQRPAWIPTFIMSESNWLFIFRLKMPQDRRRMAELSGPMVEQPITDKYGYWIYNDQWNVPTYTRGLRISRKEQQKEMELAS